MLDPKIIKKDIDLIYENLNKKKFSLNKKLFLELDSNRKKIIAETESLKNKKNILSKEIGVMKSKGENLDSHTLEVEKINSSLKVKQELLIISENKFYDFLLSVPNVLDGNVPDGVSEKDNKVIRFSSDGDLGADCKKNFSDHSVIGKALKL